MVNSENMTISGDRSAFAPLEQWPVHKGRPLLIGGPCSAESEEQVLATAAALAASGRVDIFRAGIWKPRTRPGNFEGVGARGLKWLSEVRERYGMPVAVEVATERHVYEALEHNIDVLWIGARTSVNPFAVQEVASALRGADVMVFVKNPVNPDLDLWTGALERISNVGINRLAAIHRGFSTWGKSPMRNQPHWQIAAGLRRRLPGLGLICDPSHMGGKRSFIAALSQKAMDLGYDGLMIETHINPESALSDKQQQLTPEELERVMESLVLLPTLTEDRQPPDALDELRSQIDMYDNMLLEILGNRMQVAETIGRYKKEHQMAILQSRRWREVKKRIVAMGWEKGLPPGFIRSVLETIHRESVSRQQNIMKEE